MSAGQLTLTPEQSTTVRLALDDAKWARVRNLAGCVACDAADDTEEPCDGHRLDMHLAEKYHALGCELFGADFSIQEAVTP